MNTTLAVKYYAGEPLEAGGTSISSGATPALRDLVGTLINPGMTVLDYGAGKHARNADFLRSFCIRTYAFDPHNWNCEGDGWTRGMISPKLDLNVNDGNPFDFCFSSYVLNVVPKHVEKEIIKHCESMSSQVVHIVRNNDVIEMLQAALKRRDETVLSFLHQHFGNDWTVDGVLQDINETRRFCEFGVQTSRGFQRLTDLEEYGYRLLRKTHGFKVYVKS